MGLSDDSGRSAEFRRTHYQDTWDRGIRRRTASPRFPQAYAGIPAPAPCTWFDTCPGPPATAPHRPQPAALLIRLSLPERTAPASPLNRLEPDPCNAVAADAQLVRRCSRQINDPPSAERSSIIDPHYDGLSGIDVRHLHGRAERQAAMRGHQVLRRCAVPRRPTIPGRHAHLAALCRNIVRARRRRGGLLRRLHGATGKGQDQKGPCQTGSHGTQSTRVRGRDHGPTVARSGLHANLTCVHRGQARVSHGGHGRSKSHREPPSNRYAFRAKRIGFLLGALRAFVPPWPPCEALLAAKG